MKRLYQLGALAGAAVLGVAAASASAAPQNAHGVGANFPDGTYTIALDGFCDVLTIVKPGAAGTPGVQSSDDPNCSPTNQFGAASSTGIGMAWEGTGTPSLVLVLARNGTWALYYDSTGTGVEGVFNSGTWSFVAPGAPAHPGLPSAASARGKLFGLHAPSAPGTQRLPGPNASTINISFDGFCDGELLNLPGSAGGPGIDGVQTGCGSNPLVGAGGGVVGMSDYMDGLFYALMSDRTWVLYEDCGDGTECYVNSGTWSSGAPAAPTQGRPGVPSGRR